MTANNLNRIDEIRRYARKAGLVALGEEHVRLGTTEEEFLNIAVERLADPAQMSGAEMSAAGRHWRKATGKR